MLASNDREVALGPNDSFRQIQRADHEIVPLRSTPPAGPGYAASTLRVSELDASATAREVGSGTSHRTASEVSMISSPVGRGASLTQSGARHLLRDLICIDFLSTVTYSRGLENEGIRCHVHSLQVRRT